MKRIILVVVLGLISCSVNAQTPTLDAVLGAGNTSSLGASFGGSVGIGTTSPTYKIEVNGDYSFNRPSALVDGGGGIFGVPGGSTSGVLFVPSDLSTNNGYFKLSFPDATSVRFNTDYDGHLSGGFQRDIQFGSNSVVRMTVTGNGNVGIGTMSPSAQLDVNGSIRTSAGSGGILTLFDNNAGRQNQLSLGADASGTYLNATYFSGGTADILFKNGGITNVILKGSGNLGIGTTSPENLLHVTSGLSTEVDVAKFQTTNAAGFTGVVIDRSANVRYALLKYATAGSNDWMAGTAYNGGVPNSAYTIGTGIQLSDAKLTLLTNGNIGIGSVSPGYKLDISGTTHSAGNIYADKKVIIGTDITSDTPGTYGLYVQNGILTSDIKVALTGDSVNWSDFVFKKGYELMPLDEVAKYVKKHEHLPSIPSAEEVKKDGVDVVGMDSKLLQKIEELTLYVIEQQKKIEALEQKLK